ncbi:Scr1 family TA system antitoxin-like transcriptional regulator [Nocardiopsis sp. EMB25]|uniref:helix-turn-helix domain-containing protein n=1 Tax=Nocardiopsis sp. EMB25 TaxID=2835867 RepID=UPI002283C9EA|nr:Scr1 family TA system antitoxin-like transcriptional regulator [Nocardiopsis sp. EMB25]MCY9784210.1 Scr1 family TA system antitoxin-like transcriptional regulator [Nocardiopsis sp. EMB25]
MAGERWARVGASGGGGRDGTADELWTRFGARVKAARENEGLSLAFVAERCLTSIAVLRDVEAGKEAPDRHQISVLDRELCAEGVLWDAWAQALITDELSGGATVTELLPSAQQIRVYAPLVLPDDFLTEDYARALDRAERPMEVRSLFCDRHRRSRLMPTSSGPPYCCVVMDADALTRVVGSVDITREQWRFLHRLVSGGRVSLHVIPHGTAHHPGLRGAFWTLSLSPRHTLAHTPHPCGPGHLISDASLVKGYVDLFATLQGAALSAPDSLRFLEKLLRSRESAPKALTTGPDPSNPDDRTPDHEAGPTADPLRSLR